MSDETRALDLDAIRARAEAASDDLDELFAPQGPMPTISAVARSADDVPALLAEVERLRAELAAQAGHMDELLDRLPDGGDPQC